MASSEHERIRRLRERYARPARSSLPLSIGDDAAVLTPGGDPLVISVDAAVQGVHFRRDMLDLKTLGHRATTAALSDLAAMGAEAIAVFSSLTLPVDFSDQDLDALSEGIADAADDCDAVVAGGNLARGPLSVHTTVVGHCPDPLRRDGAKPGDGLWISGDAPLGGVALGLAALLQQQDIPRYADAIEAWRRPRAHIAEGVALRGLATACLDVSDGLVQDLEHLCTASKVGAVLDPGALPVTARFAQDADALGKDPKALILYGGELYRLIFTLPNGVEPSFPAQRLGTIDLGDGVRWGAEEKRLRGGFDHFS